MDFPASLPAPTTPEGATCNVGPCGGNPAGVAPTVSKLEAAARVLRAALALLAAEHADGTLHTDYGDKPWQVEECAEGVGGGTGCPCIVYQGDYAPLGKPQNPPILYIADAASPGVATWITLLHPGVGEHLAGLCDDVAELVTRNPELERPHVDGEPCDDLACRITTHLRGIAAAITPKETP